MMMLIKERLRYATGRRDVIGAGVCWEGKSRNMKLEKFGPILCGYVVLGLVLLVKLYNRIRNWNLRIHLFSLTKLPFFVLLVSIASASALLHSHKYFFAFLNAQ